MLRLALTGTRPDEFSKGNDALLRLKYLADSLPVDGREAPRSIRASVLGSIQAQACLLVGLVGYPMGDTQVAQFLADSHHVGHVGIVIGVDANDVFLCTQLAS